MITVKIPDRNYPQLLKEIINPPSVLYIETFQKDLQKLFQIPAVAVVGSRKITSYGRAVTRKLTKQLVEKGFLIVSGLAKGVDLCAHQTTIENGGFTIAVLGSGLDQIYPPQHVAIAQTITKHGALISEFPPGTKAQASHFPQRNRIIAGLTFGVLVTQAAEKSGSLITASFAADFGREVFAVAGPINSYYSKGTNQLIQKGAKLVTDINDILEELPLV